MIDEILKYFEKICSIPHNTFCEKELSNYIVDFAKENNFIFNQDNFNNVYIKKIVDNKEPKLVFQSHLDMVCVKDPNYEIDFSKDPIKLIKTKNYLKAYKTSLGADNGIGVAIILTLLKFAPFSMEALFTTDEEVSTTGAENFDYSLIKSKNLISLDGFRANEMIVGCASICDMKITFKNNFTKKQSQGYKITISGLKGGHSGAEIHKNLGNAIKISNNILKCFDNVQLESFKCGNQFNFIPNFSTICFVGNKNEKKFEEIKNTLQKEYPLLQVTCEETTVNNILDEKQSKNVLEFIDEINTGVIKQDKTGIILSQNLAFINLEEGLIKISQRGAEETLENKNIEHNKLISAKHNFNFEIFDKKPGFSTDKNCDLVKTLSKQSIKTNKIGLKKSVKHVSLEECVFQSKMPDKQMVVISPKIEFPHSIKEKVYLPSIEKTYNLLQNFLKSL